MRNTEAPAEPLVDDIDAGYEKAAAFAEKSCLNVEDLLRRQSPHLSEPSRFSRINEYRIL